MTGIEIVFACIALFILICINGNLARLASHHERFPAPAPAPPAGPDPVVVEPVDL